MRKIYKHILEFSPSKLAIYLVLSPVVLAIIHTVFSIIYNNVSKASTINEIVANVTFNIIFLCLGVFILIWLLWLCSTVYTIDKTKLGLKLKWFNIAYVVLLFFILFNISDAVIEYLTKTQHWNTDYKYLIYSSREFINFAGIIIAYPIVCHYAARATLVKKNNKPTTFINALPFTLLLIFGTVIGIPFLHKYFSSKVSSSSKIITIYAIAFGLFIILLIIGFIASITGLV